MLENNPRNISAKINGMGLSDPTFNRITHEDLRWYPYKVKVRQQLKDTGSTLKTSFRLQLLVSPAM